MAGNLLADFEEKGFRDIVVLDETWHEESSGFQAEHTRQTVVARQGSEYFRLVGHETRRCTLLRKHHQ